MTISSAGLVRIPADLTVSGTTTTINTTNLDVEDKNITLEKYQPLAIQLLMEVD